MAAGPGFVASGGERVVHHVDIAPTLLELAGIQGLPGSAGVALGPVWRGAAELPERVVFADVGAEVSGSRGDVFERLRLEGDLGDTREGSRVSYRWASQGWEAADPDAALSLALDGYGAREPDLMFADEPDSAERQRLKALGYVEPSDETAPDAR